MTASLAKARRSLKQLVRRIPIFCATCDRLRLRHRYDMCGECWQKCCRITWSAIWWDKEESPNAPALPRREEGGV